MSTEAANFCDTIPRGDGPGSLPDDDTCVAVLYAVASLMRESEKDPARHRLFFAGHEAIRRRTGLGLSTIRNKIGRLIELGILTKQRPGRGARGGVPDTIRIVGFSPVPTDHAGGTASKATAAASSPPEAANEQGSRGVAQPNAVSPECDDWFPAGEPVALGWASGWDRPTRAAVDDLRADDVTEPVASAFIDRVRGALNPPAHVDGPTFVRQLGDRLGRFSADILATAAAHMRDTRHRDLPSVPDIVVACAERARVAPSTGVSITRTTQPAACDAWLAYAEARRASDHRMGTIWRMLNKHDTALVPSLFPPDDHRGECVTDDDIDNPADGLAVAA